MTETDQVRDPALYGRLLPVCHLKLPQYVYVTCYRMRSDVQRHSVQVVLILTSAGQTHLRDTEGNWRLLAF